MRKQNREAKIHEGHQIGESNTILHACSLQIELPPQSFSNSTILHRFGPSYQCSCLEEYETYFCTINFHLECTINIATFYLCGKFLGKSKVLFLSPSLQIDMHVYRVQFKGNIYSYLVVMYYHCIMLPDYILSICSTNVFSTILIVQLRRSYLRLLGMLINCFFLELKLPRGP